ncbi:amidase [Variovorax sp. UC74_104]|uniref:amidase n=1 Tax=Variovorax sp. UC74_104 TaxID=3374555 RepID=UPI003756BB15
MDDTTPGPLWRLSAFDLVAGYRASRFTPLDAAKACLERVARCEPELHAMVCVDAPGALHAATESAARWQAGVALGDLDGVPLTLKDNLHARGLPTRWGSLLTRPEAQPQDELPVRRVREAGGVILGKTQLPEFALQGFTASRLGGVTRNPRDLRLSPGGSSGGAAASVAAGYAPLAIATDGGGSIRRPAAYCGVLGYKPSEGLVPREGGLPDLFEGHEVVGCLARSLPDLRALLDVLAGAPLAKPAAQETRILLLTQMGTRPVDSRIVGGVRAFARHAMVRGHRVTEGTDASWAEPVHALWPRLSALGLAHLLENASQWPDLLGTGDATAGLAACEPHTREVYAAGCGLEHSALRKLRDAIEGLRRRLDTLLAEFDFILTPATSARAWPLEEPFPAVIEGQAAGARSDAVFTPFVNALGLCAISVPCALVDGLPVSAQIVGARGDDARLLSVAAELFSSNSYPLAQLPGSTQ